MITSYLIAFAIALVSQNISEWLFHKYVLHKLGLNRDSFFHYHWEHHRRCKKNNNIDSDYVIFFMSGIPSKMITKEIFLMLGANLLIALPTYLFVWPPLGIAYFVVAWYYYFSHALSHASPRFNFLMPWHKDHHTLSNQHHNWCVTFPWLDWFAGTRVKAPKSTQRVS